MMEKLEIACFNPESALIAQQGGADRVELCDEIFEGGTTPDYEVTKQVREQLHIDLFVMIRPRGGNFVYSPHEFLKMKEEILDFKKLGVNGFVFGMLNEDKSVNIEWNTELVALAKPLPCTFHRAFDAVSDAFQALEDVIDCGFTTILTSGTKPNVVRGIEELKELVEKADDRITIMPGGGLRSSNIAMIKEKTKAQFYHSSAITDGGDTADIGEVKMLKSNLG